MAWADNNYVHKKQITIDHTKVAGNEVDFPILIKITDGNLTGCRADGYDIKFYDSTESIQLKHEIQRWVKATGELIAWVKIPSLSSIVDTIIYIYYQYPSEPVDQEDPPNVWDANFVMVQHMNGANAGAINDSTANNNDVTSSNGCNFQQNGKIGYAVDFDSTNNEYLAVADSASLDVNDEATLEGWHYMRQWAGGVTVFAGLAINKWAAAANKRSYSISAQDTGANISIWIYCDGTGNWTVQRSHCREDAFAYNTWHSIVGVIPPGINKLNHIYLNGSDLIPYPATLVQADQIYVSDRDLHIGCKENNPGVQYQFYDGLIDEVRISNIARTDNWIETTFNTQNNPSTFMSFGAEETNPLSPTYEFKFPLKSKFQYYKYDVKKTQHDKYRNKKGKDYKYKIKEE